MLCYIVLIDIYFLKSLSFFNILIFTRTDLCKLENVIRGIRTIVTFDHSLLTLTF